MSRFISFFGDHDHILDFECAHEECFSLISLFLVIHCTKTFEHAGQVILKLEVPGCTCAIFDWRIYFGICMPESMCICICSPFYVSMCGIFVFNSSI